VLRCAADAQRAQEGVTTGISAAERAATCRALADPLATQAHFQRPGHIFPLRYRRGGVLNRAGHTEASVDLARLAGCAPAGVLSELVNDDGTMQRAGQLRDFGRRHGLKVVTISDLIRFRRYGEATVERTAVARLPTQWGLFACHSYRSLIDGIEHVAMVYGDLGDGENVLCRVHSECLTGDIFQSARCDCGPQLGAAMAKVAREGRGVVVYLRGQEGRGIGLGHKLKAYNLQDSGRDTVQANTDLGLPVDSREYGTGAQMLLDLGVRSLKLMTNNPSKFLGLRGYGLSITGRVPLLMPITPENRRYIETKRTKMGHFSGSEFLAPGYAPRRYRAVTRTARSRPRALAGPSTRVRNRSSGCPAHRAMSPRCRLPAFPRCMRGARDAGMEYGVYGVLH